MLEAIFKKRARVATAIFAMLVLSALFTATSTHAVTVFVEGHDNVSIEIADGVELEIPRGALKEDTFLSADMEITEDQVRFIFGPSAMEFKKSLKLRIRWDVIEGLDLETFTLFGPDGEEIEPQINDSEMTWKIPHFSLYYHRRR